MKTPQHRNARSPSMAPVAGATQGRRAAPSSTPAAKTRWKAAAEAEETLAAIRAGQVDALVIQTDDAHQLYALRKFADLAQTELALATAGAERASAYDKLRALVEERELLFQDMHDGCIQSIYAVGLNLETCLRLIEANPKKVSQMIAEASASLNLVIQELRSFINGRRLQLTAGEDLRTEILKAAKAAGNHGLTVAVDIDSDAMRALTGEQSLHVLQIAREAISNVARHANAHHGQVNLHRKKGVIRLEVSDDGRGFSPGDVTGPGLGLHHIDARARKMGGVARVRSSPNKGTRVVVELRSTP